MLKTLTYQGISRFLKIVEPINPFDIKAKKHNYLKHFQDHKVIFIHIPKTGGMSILESLFGEVIGGHRTIQDYIELWGKDVVEGYFTSCIVRDPIDRFISALNYLSSGGNNLHDKAFALKHLSQIDDINAFIENRIEEVVPIKIHFLPQSHFIFDHQGQIRVDFIGKFENIEEDFKRICTKLNLNVNLLHSNKTKVKKYSIRDLSTNSIIKLQKIYAEDYATLGYSNRI